MRVLGIHILLFIMILVTHAKGQSDYNFAESLFKEGDYYRAITFYKKYMYFNRSSKLISDANYKIGLCYQKAKQIKPALEYFDKVIKQHPDTIISMKSKFQMGYTKYIGNLYPFAIIDFQQFIKDHPKTEYSDYAQYLTGMSSIQLLNWNKAYSDFQTLSTKYPNSKYSQMSNELALECKKGTDLPKKHAWLAGIMSTVIPGSGQIYCDRYLDGVTAFLINVTLLSITIISATNDDIHNGYAYAGGGLFSIFYFSNIYGAMNAAQNGSRIIQINYKNYLLEKYGFKPEKKITCHITSHF